MSLNDEQHVLEAVANLTRQREQETLASALINAILKLTDATNIDVYGLGGELGLLSAKLLATSNRPASIGSYLTALESRPELKDCIDRQETIHSNHGDVLRLTHPVIEQGIVAGLICHDWKTAHTDQQDIIHQLIQIYANQQSLLNHQQRDGLTGLYNRVALQNWLSKALADDSHADRRTRDETPLGCFAIFDIDFFKRINDSRGHLYGDEVLLTIADLMRESFRFNDLLFRYGGEEFVAILNDTELDSALTVLERFRATVSQYKFAHINQVTVTIGVVQIAAHLKPGLLIERADMALYYGKDHGRNQVNAYEWLEQGHIAPTLEDRPYNIKLF